MQEMQETCVCSLSWEELLGEEMVTHSSILALENIKDRGTWEATGHGVTKSQTCLSNSTRDQSLLHCLCMAQQKKNLFTKHLLFWSQVVLAVKNLPANANKSHWFNSRVRKIP